MINEALFAIRHDLAALVSMMRAKGHAQATATARIAAGSVGIDLHTCGPKAFRWSAGMMSAFEFCSGETFSEALAQAEKIITEKMDDSPEIACAAWFDVAQLAEPIAAEAAE